MVWKQQIWQIFTQLLNLLVWQGQNKSGPPGWTSGAPVCCQAKYISVCLSEVHLSTGQWKNSPDHLWPAEIDSRASEPEKHNDSQRPAFPRLQKAFPTLSHRGSNVLCTTSAHIYPPNQYCMWGQEISCRVCIHHGLIPQTLRLPWEDMKLSKKGKCSQCCVAAGPLGFKLWSHVPLASR